MKNDYKIIIETYYTIEEINSLLKVLDSTVEELILPGETISFVVEKETPPVEWLTEKRKKDFEIKLKEKMPGIKIKSIKLEVVNKTF